MRRLFGFIGILFLFAVATTSGAFAEDGKRFTFGVSVDIGAGVTSLKPALDSDWQGRFTPAGGTMKVATSSNFATIGLGAEISTALTRSGNIRIPISYQLIDVRLADKNSDIYFARQGISASGTSWWDYVIAGDVVANHFSPRVGLEIGGKGFAVIPSVQHYQLVNRKFYGIDCQGCKNSSKVYSKEILESGISPRLDIVKKLGDSGSTQGIGLYVESLGPKVWRFGVNFRCCAK